MWRCGRKYSILLLGMALVGAACIRHFIKQEEATPLSPISMSAVAVEAATAQQVQDADVPKTDVHKGDRISVRDAVSSIFTSIYNRGAWTVEGNGSGPGSTLVATSRTRELLLKIIRDHKITSMADVPCGAMAWMPTLLQQVEREIPGFQYFGGDIVQTVVDTNIATFSTDHPNWTFELFDMTVRTVPPGYELIHCRDALQHLSMELVVEALRNFAESHARLLVVGSYSPESGAENTKITDGDYFPINLRVEPFLLAEPLAVFNEETQKYQGERDKHMLVYDVEYLRSIDYDAMVKRVAVLRRRLRMRVLR